METNRLKKLCRRELLEILVEQSEKIDVLERELSSVRAELEDRRIDISKAGSIAEASLGLNKVFLAAENAAKQYLDNIIRVSGAQEEVCARREEESLKKAELMISEAKRISEEMISEAREKSQKYWDEVTANAKSIMQTFNAESIMSALGKVTQLVNSAENRNESDF